MILSFISRGLAGDFSSEIDNHPVTAGHRCKRTRPYLISAGIVGGVLIGVLGFIGIALADEGRFEVRRANSRLSDGVFYVTARIDYRISDEALEALQSGVALTIRLEIEVTQIRRFWPDREVASLQQAFQLSYQPLTEHYIVKNLNSGEQDSSATLYSALNRIGRVVDLPVIDASLLDPDGNYRISLRTVLDTNTLPGPLRLVAFWTDELRLESDWYRWKLNE